MLVRPGRSRAIATSRERTRRLIADPLGHVHARPDDLATREREAGDAGLLVMTRDLHPDDRARVEAPRVTSKVEAVRYLLDGAARDDLPFIHQHQIRCKAHDLVDFVAHVEGRDPELPGKAFDEGEDLLLAVLVERSERFVHQEQPRVREHRAGEGDPLAFPAREGGDAPAEEGLEVHEADDRLGLEQPFVLRGAAMAVQDVSPHREVREQARVLEDEAGAAVASGDEGPVVLPHRAVEGDPAARLRFESCDRTQQGRLAAARGSEDRGNPREADVERCLETEVAPIDGETRLEAWGAPLLSGRHGRGSAG